MADLVFAVRGTAEVIAEQQKIADQQGKQKTLAKELSAEYAANEAELKKLGRTAQQIYAANESAQEKYNRKLAEAKAALEGNANGTELLAREQKRLSNELLNTITASNQLTTAEQNRAKAIQGIMQANETSQEKFTRKLAEAKTALKGTENEAQELLKTEKRLKKEMEDADKQQNKTFSPLSITAWGTAAAAAALAIAAVSNELRAQQEMIDKRNAAQLTVGESRNVLLRNMDETKPEEIKKVQASARKIAGDTGVSEVSINNALAATLSSTSGNADLSVSLVQMAAKYLKDKPTEIGGFAGTMADLTRITGSGDPNVQLGLLRRIGQLSRITDAETQARNIAPAVIGTAPFGGSGRVSGALFAALSGGAADVEGRKSGTAEIELAKQLSTFDFGQKESGERYSKIQEEHKTAIAEVAKLQREIADATQEENEASKRHRETLGEQLSKAKERLARAKETQTDAIAKIAEDKKIETLRGGGKTPTAASREEQAERNRERGERLTGENQRVRDAEAEVAKVEKELAAGGHSHRIEHLQRSLSEATAKEQALQKQRNAQVGTDTRIGNRIGAFQATDLLGRIQALQQDPVAAEEFLKKASFETKAVGPIRQLLLDPNSKVAKDFAENLGKIPDNAGLATIGQQSLGIFKYNSLDSVEERKRRLSGGLEQIQTLKPSDRLSTEELQILKDDLMETGSTDAGARFSEFIGRVKGGGTVTTGEAENILRNRIGELRHPSVHLSGVGDGDPGGDLDRPATREEISQAAILQKVLDELITIRTQAATHQAMMQHSAADGDGAPLNSAE